MAQHFKIDFKVQKIEVTLVMLLLLLMFSVIWYSTLTDVKYSTYTLRIQYVNRVHLL